MNRIAIVGASVGGVKAAQALRGGGFRGELLILDGERITEPYDRPPLSKAYLDGSQDAAAISLLRREELDSLDATWRFGAEAVHLDADRHIIRLRSGENIAYDAVVLATGAKPRPSPWGTGPGMHTLRTRADADALRQELRPGRRLAIIGGGFIGCEVAATARASGVEVTIVDPLPSPMSRALDGGVGQLFLQKLATEGVDTKFGESVERLDRVSDEWLLSLSRGQQLIADVVLVSIGAEANTGWLEDSGLSLDDGVLCDGWLRAHGAADVFAVGDVCRWQPADGAPSRRLEHWTGAAEQAAVVAHNILNPGHSRAYLSTDYVWSDQFDWKIQVVGRAGGGTKHMVGSPVNNRFAVLQSVDGVTLSGAVVVNWPRALVAVRRAVSSPSGLSEVAEQLRKIDEKQLAPRPA